MTGNIRRPFLVTIISFVKLENLFHSGSSSSLTCKIVLNSYFTIENITSIWSASLGASSILISSGDIISDLSLWIIFVTQMEYFRLLWEIYPG